MGVCAGWGGGVEGGRCRSEVSGGSSDRPGLAPGRFRNSRPVSPLRRFDTCGVAPVHVSANSGIGQSAPQLNRGGRHQPTRQGQCAGYMREDMMLERLEQQKKLTPNQWRLICTANVADLLDFFDFFLIGYVTLR